MIEPYNVDKEVAAIEAIIAPYPTIMPHIMIRDEGPPRPMELSYLLNAIERSLHTRIDENKPEHKLAVGVILQAISDYCNDDAYLPVPIYKRKEADISGTQFLEGEGLRYWAWIAGLSHEEIYKIAVKTKNYIKKLDNP